jgi:hypothetical protein
VRVLITGKSTLQVRALLSITVDDWTEQHGQGRVAEWFARAHSTDARLQFFIGAGGGELPLWNPNANAIEAWHRLGAGLRGMRMRATLTGTIEDTVRIICKDASLLRIAKGWPLQPTFIPKLMAEVALDRFDNGPQPVNNADHSAFKILSRRFVRKNPEVTAITRPLLQAYNRSLNGKFKRDTTKEEAQDVATSMHTIRRDLRYKGPTNMGYRCDCKRFVHIGLCSCVLLVEQHGRGLDLASYIAK